MSALEASEGYARELLDFLAKREREVRVRLAAAERDLAGMSAYLGSARGFEAYRRLHPFGLLASDVPCICRMFRVPLEDVPMLLACGGDPGGFVALMHLTASSRRGSLVALAEDVLKFRLEEGA